MRHGSTKSWSRLEAELVRLSPIELILDDVHELSEPRKLDVLAYLLEEIPPGSQVVLVTRADPKGPGPSAHSG